MSWPARAPTQFVLSMEPRLKLKISPSAVCFTAAIRACLLGSRDSPGLATPAEADGGERVARVVVVALRRVVDTRAGNGGEEALDGGRRAVHDGGAGVDDGLEAGDDGLAVHVRLRAGDLPEAGGGVDVVELERARVELVVRAAEVELRA